MPVYLFDSKGLVTTTRGDTLAAHKLPFAKDIPSVKDFEEAIRTLRPTAIVGLSAQSGAFTESIVKAMTEINERPIVFALSNPTSSARRNRLTPGLTARCSSAAVLRLIR